MMAKVRVKLTELPRLGRSRFRVENSVRYQMIAYPFEYQDSGRNKLVYKTGKQWLIVGWGDNLDDALMRDRAGNIALMVFHPTEGEVWTHFPILEGHTVDDVVFITEE